uniref:DUF4220 domain-containing protein n=1 Tax=Leersia perrieri TaxID=77586 RepID=A0A0D9W2G3_9ORYZ
MGCPSVAIKMQQVDEEMGRQNGPVFNPTTFSLSKGTIALTQIETGETFLWACNNSGSSDTILTWHIATSILEVRHSYKQGSPLISVHKVAATHLSRYCVYLMSCYPELLPDNNIKWIKSLYKVIRMDSQLALIGHDVATGLSDPEAKYKKVVDLLTANSNDEVLKNGVRLGKQFVDLMDEEMAWRVMAIFWSEMVLYIAQSSSAQAHLEAIARGCELLTPLWALLAHAGIVSLP